MENFEGGSILADAIGMIGGLARDASGAKGKLEIVNPEREPNYIYLAVKPDGEYDRLEADPAPRTHLLGSFSEVIPYVETKGTKDNSVIWFDRCQVVIVLNDETRRDRASLKLNLTPQVLKLIELEKSRKGLEQKPFVRLLRIDLADALPDTLLLEWVRGVRFTSQGNAAGIVRHGRESLGSDIDEQITSELGSDCPEEVALRVRIFDDPAVTAVARIRCAVEIDVPAKEFMLTPLPLELHNAIEAAVTDLGTELEAADKCPVFRGRP
jgi:hypothetical protein